MAESVPYQYIDSTGAIVSDTSTILADVQQEYKDAFNKQDLNVSPSTPQGVLITAEAASRVELVKNNTAVANQINPNLAGGIFLDAILALTGMSRVAQTQTVVPGVVLTGVPSTIIPVGTQAKSVAGDVFASLSTVTLDGSGNATVNFASVEYGVIPCVVNTLTQPVTDIIGWETVNNPNTATLGTTTQSDIAGRALRNNTLAFNSVSLIEAITSALYATSGVQSLWAQENVADSTQTINGISMVSHSIYVCANGGSDTDVAAALLENKSSGCAWNGSTSINVIEPASGQVYNVKFDRPTQVQILIKVTTTNGNADNIKQAILDYAAGNISGLPGFKVGTPVSTFEIAGAIVTENPGYYISKVEIAVNSGSPVYSTNPISIGVNQIAFTESAFITVIIS